MKTFLYYDFHVNSPILAEEAERLGYSGLALVIKGNDHNVFESLNSPSVKLNIFKSILIKAKNPDDLRRKLNKFRENADVVMVQGGDQKINRAACEDPRVDILSKPYYNRSDCGINHVMAKKAAENQVAVELNIKYLGSTSSYLRYKVLFYYREILKLKRKFGFPVTITSDAHNLYDLHSPLDLIALARCFGMDPEEAKTALSNTPQMIIKRSKTRKKVLVDGVRLIGPE